MRACSNAMDKGKITLNDVAITNIPLHVILSLLTSPDVFWGFSPTLNDTVNLFLTFNNNNREDLYNAFPKICSFALHKSYIDYN